MMKTQLKSTVLEALADKKAKAVSTLDIANHSDFTDYMIVATGNSTTHVRSIADDVVSKAKACKIKPLGIEGIQAGEWVLIDLGDVVVHVMLAETRDFYDLERLWSPSIMDYAKQQAMAC